MRTLWKFLAIVVALGVASPALAQSRRSDDPARMPVPTFADTSNTTLDAYVWGGVAWNNGYVGGYGGGVIAFNGNLISDGLILRAEGGGGQYDYNLIQPGGANNFEVSTNNASALVGYRTAVGQGWLTGYLGVQREEQANDVDPNAELQGSETGFKGIVEYWVPVGDKWQIVAFGSAAEPFGTWVGYGRLTYMVTDRIKIGPETMYFENQAYRDGRIGGYMSLDVNWGEISISGGYRHPYTDSPDGYYANVTVGVPLWNLW